MAAEAVDEVEVADLRMWPDDRVLVEGVVFVEPGPGALQLELGNFSFHSLHGKLGGERLLHFGRQTLEVLVNV